MGLYTGTVRSRARSNAAALWAAPERRTTLLFSAFARSNRTNLGVQPEYSIEPPERASVIQGAGTRFAVIPSPFGDCKMYELLLHFHGVEQHGC